LFAVTLLCNQRPHKSPTFILIAMAALRDRLMERGEAGCVMSNDKFKPALHD
jgi:hypothetical protein